MSLQLSLRRAYLTVLFITSFGATKPATHLLTYPNGAGGRSQTLNPLVWENCSLGWIEIAPCKNNQAKNLDDATVFEGYAVVGGYPFDALVLARNATSQMSWNRFADLVLV